MNAKTAERIRRIANCVSMKRKVAENTRRVIGKKKKVSNDESEDYDTSKIIILVRLMSDAMLFYAMVLCDELRLLN